MTERPILAVPKTKMEVLHDVISAVVLISMFAYLFFLWPSLPETLPIHFNAKGQADGWSGRGTLFLLPVIISLVFLGLTILRKYPHKFNYLRQISAENAARHYRLAITALSWIKIEIVVLFAYVQWKIIQSAVEGADRMGSWFMPFFLLLFLVTVITYAVRSSRMA